MNKPLKMTFEEAENYARQNEKLVGQRFVTIGGNEYEIQQLFIYYKHSSKEQLQQNYNRTFPNQGAGFIATKANMTQSNEFEVYGAAYCKDSLLILPIDYFGDNEKLSEIKN